MGQYWYPVNLDRKKDPVTRRWTYLGIRINTGSETLRNSRRQVSLGNASRERVSAEGFGTFRHGVDDLLEAADA